MLFGTSLGLVSSLYECKGYFQTFRYLTRASSIEELHGLQEKRRRQEKNSRWDLELACPDSLGSLYEGHNWSRSMEFAEEEEGIIIVTIEPGTWETRTSIVVTSRPELPAQPRLTSSGRG